MEKTMTFGKKLKMLRVGKDLTQDEMASGLGITRRAYIPYEQDKARPRNEATYQKMAEILDCDIHELTDLVSKPSPKSDFATTATALLAAAGAAALPVAAGAAGLVATTSSSANVAYAAVVALTAASRGLSAMGKKSAKEKTLLSNNVLEYSDDMILQYTNRQKKFQATAKGILFTDFSQRRIEFRPGILNDLENRGAKPDDYITVFNSDIHSWWFSYWAKDPELDKHVPISPEERAGAMISRYTTAAFDPYRRISIVVDDNELFDKLIAYRNHNCYHGNMTAILVDVENVKFIKEEAIAELDDPSEFEKTLITQEG